MRLTLRSHETRRLVDILENGSYETAEQMARALFKEAASIIQMRDLIVLAHTWNGGTKGLNIGPFGSMAEVESFVKKVPLGGTGRAVPITSSGILLANQTGGSGWPGYCYDPQCGHLPTDHAIVSATRGSCVLPECECEQFLKDDPATKKPTKSKGARAK